MLGSKKILVIGDIMLDIYYTGEVSRISPEAPVPVFKKKNERCVLGGASNVVANLAAGNQNVSLMSLIGNDDYGHTMKNLLGEIGVDCSNIEYWNRPTITKTRFLAENNQQVLRLDVEESRPISENEEEILLNKAEKMIDSFDSVIISDYMKGLLTFSFTQGIIRLANQHNIKVLVDVKDPDFKKYAGAWLLKPNKKELNALTQMPVDTEDELVTAASFLLDQVKCKYVLTTCGSKGMVLVGEDTTYHLDTVGKAVYDVTGAGDTTIAYLTAALSNGLDIEEAMRVANYAAGIQVGKVGTSTVYLHEVEDALKSNHKIKNVFKINERKELVEQINDWKSKGETVVTTNGCFDILHRGHISLLEAAKKHGDHLIVMINSDASVKRLKGESRPINSEEDRAMVMAALDCVDAVALFDPEVDNKGIPDQDVEGLSDELRQIASEAPMGILKTIVPDVHVKGGDYTVEQVPEAMYAKEFVSVPFVQGYSTTRTIEKSKNSKE